MTDVITHACNNNPANELVVSHFATSPATLIADYGDSSSLMYKQASTEGEAVVVWGYGATPMRCKRVN